MRARGAEAKVILCEVDPLRALEAVMDGYQVMLGEGRLINLAAAEGHLRRSL